MEQLRVNKIDMMDFEFRKNRKNRELPVAMVSLKLPGYGEKKKIQRVTSGYGRN